MNRYANGHQLAAAMEAEGIPLPKNCHTARIVSSVNDAITVEFTCFLEIDDIEKLGKAFQRLAQAEKE